MVLKHLSRLWASWKEPLPTPRYGAELSIEELARQEPEPMDSSAAEAIAELLRFLLAPLGESLASSVLERVTWNLESGDSAISALMDCRDLNVSDKSLFVFADWKWWGEIEWQVNRVLRTLAVEESWVWARPEGERSVPIGLFDFGEWIEQRGYRLLHVDTGGDDVLAIPVLQEDVAALHRLASRAGMPILTDEEAKVLYGLDD